jgi:hypothetical protein
MAQTQKGAPSRPNAPGSKDIAMKTYTGTLTPNRHDLTDTRSAGSPSRPQPQKPRLNDRRSTR